MSMAIVSGDVFRSAGFVVSGVGLGVLLCLAATAVSGAPGTAGTPAAKPAVTPRGYVVHSIDSAPATSKPVLDAINKGAGFIPNIYAVYSESPALLKGDAAIGEALAASTLSPIEKNLVAIAAAVENHSGYCVPGHCTVGKGMGMTDDALAAVKNDSPLADKKLEALRVFTRDLVKARGAIAAEQLDAFLAAGYTRANSLDVVAIIAQKTASTIVFNLTGVPLDEAFKAQSDPVKK